jgi:DNA repair exonuclease SbcCD nuclease subunit
LNNLQFKVVNVPDLHLYDDEVGYTIGYYAQSIKILDDLIELYKKDESIDLVILGGDLQHKQPNTLKSVTMFEKLLTKLATLVYRRLEMKGLLEHMTFHFEELNTTSGEYEWSSLPATELDTFRLLPSVRGNHDDSSDEYHSLFDHLLDLDIIIKPRILSIGTFQFNFIHYTHDESRLNLGKMYDDTTTIIAIHHTGVVEAGYNKEVMIGKRIDAGLTAAFAGVDLAVMNHIHHAWGERDYEGTIVVTPGSAGRPGYDDKHKRDYYNLFAVTCIEEEEQNIFDRSNYVMPLIPWEQFFGAETTNEIKKRKSEFETFKLGVRDSYMDIFDPVKEILRMDMSSIEREDMLEVKARCISALSVEGYSPTDVENMLADLNLE